VFLTRAGLLEMLREGVSEVVVPEPVFQEVRSHGLDDPTVRAIDAVGWLCPVPVANIDPDVDAWDLGPGESAVLTVAKFEPGAWAVIDDLEARRCARTLKIPVIGTLGLVLLAKQLGHIRLARPVLEHLKASGMYLSTTLIDQVLARVGE
jgi:predicted nucleic acid-binding protein